MGNDSLLIGWDRIHEELFVDDRGKRMMSISTLQQKYGPKLKSCGALFKYHRGSARTRVIAGWKSVIQNYFIKLGQEEDKARQKVKLAKAANSSK